MLVILCKSDFLRFSGTVVTQKYERGFCVSSVHIDLDADIVDVHPFYDSILALGRGGDVFLVSKAKVERLSSNEIKVGYNVFSAKGYLFILSNYGLYIIRNFIDFKEKMFMQYLPMEPVDASLVDDKWLLIVLVNEVLELDIDSLDEDKHFVECSFKVSVSSRR